MATYIRVPIETDPDTLAQDVYNYIIARSSQWVPNDGNLDVWIIQGMSANAAESRDLASDVLDTIYRDFGSSIMGIPPQDAASASGTTTWTMIDNIGHTIPANTIVSIPGADQAIGFYTLFDVVVPVGQTTTQPGEVQIVAVLPGEAATNLGTAGMAIQLVDVLDYVQTVTLVAPTVGGVDAEADEDYLNRLVRRMRGLSQRPILPIDFSEMAKDADPGVYRAVALDGFNPADSTYNNEKMIAIAAVDESGNAATPAMKTNIDNLLEANREVNFIVNEIDPNYTIINITASVSALPGADPTALIESVQGAFSTYLSPGTWGRDLRYTDASASTTWIETPTLYYNELITVASNVDGVARVVDLTCAKQGGTLARTDVALVTPAALTRPGTITVTVV